MAEYPRDLVTDDLLQRPEESLDIEFKGWLDLNDSAHQADLAKAVLALANHGGGIVVIGFSGRPLVPAPKEQGVDERFTTDTVNNIVLKYAEPPFHVEVIRHGGYPVLLVPGGHRVPVVARRSGPNEVHVRQQEIYIRRPGPRSETPKSAFEWRELFERIQRNGVEAVAVRAIDDGLDEPQPGADSPPTLAERMTTNQRPRHAAGPPNELTPEDRYVFEAPLSDSRIEKFREEVHEEWARLPMTALFRAAGTLRHVDVYESGMRFGVVTPTFKGPFVEGSNWADLPGREFAYGLERYLLDRFTELLDARQGDADPLVGSADVIAGFIEGAADDIRQDGGTADVAVLAGRLPEHVAVDIYRVTDWQGPAVVRGVDVSTMSYMHRPVGGLPILWYRSDRDPALFVVDLDDHEVERTIPVEGEATDLAITVRPIDESDARVRIRKDREWLSALYRSTHSGVEGELSVEEAVVQLMMRVRLDVVAAGTVREIYVPRTRSVRLA